MRSTILSVLFITVFLVLNNMCLIKVVLVIYLSHKFYDTKVFYFLHYYIHTILGSSSFQYFFQREVFFFFFFKGYAFIDF